MNGENGEYRTVNADLAAALITVGVRMRDMSTSDGVTVEFAFDTVAPDGSLLTDIVEKWSHGSLLVDASTYSRNTKRIYKNIRDTKREFENSR